MPTLTSTDLASPPPPVRQPQPRQPRPRGPIQIPCNAGLLFPSVTGQRHTLSPVTPRAIGQPANEMAPAVSPEPASLPATQQPEPASPVNLAPTPASRALALLARFLTTAALAASAHLLTGLHTARRLGF